MYFLNTKRTSRLPDVSSRRELSNLREHEEEDDQTDD